jgi:hypothetical protein
MFNQFLINSIIACSIFTLIALGFSIYSTTKFFHFDRMALYFAAIMKNENDFSGDVSLQNFITSPIFVISIR